MPALHPPPHARKAQVPSPVSLLVGADRIGPPEPAVRLGQRSARNRHRGFGSVPSLERTQRVEPGSRRLRLDRRCGWSMCRGQVAPPTRREPQPLDLGWISARLRLAGGIVQAPTRRHCSGVAAHGRSVERPRLFRR
eukprot:scaffold5055_cov58-Phaeocystis_antarctica.AAC.10